MAGYMGLDMTARIIVSALLAAALGVLTVGACEQPVERPLKSLTRSCLKMRAMQLAVQSRTKKLHMVIEGHPDKKPRATDWRAAVRLAKQQRAIIAEVNKAVKMLEAEGSAVAFPEVFRQVRDDMIQVQFRLEIGNVGIKTQTLEADIVETLREMVMALTKS